MIQKQIGIKSIFPENRVYITYRQDHEACLAILASNNFRINGDKLQVSFGMTRLCHNFILAKRCKNHKCTYIHYIPDKQDTTFNKLREFNPELKKLSE